MPTTKQCSPSSW